MENKKKCSQSQCFIPILHVGHVDQKLAVTVAEIATSWLSMQLKLSVGDWNFKASCQQAINLWHLV